MKRNQIGKVGKTAVSLKHRGNGTAENRPLNSAKSFVVAEEEKLVLAIINLGDYHRTTRREAKLVLAERPLRPPACVFEEVGSVELIISEEFPNGAMKAIRAGFDGGI